MISAFGWHVHEIGFLCIHSGSGLSKRGVGRGKACDRALVFVELEMPFVK